MVKIEDNEDIGLILDPKVGDGIVPKVEASDLESLHSGSHVKSEGNIASSSSSLLKSNFLGMGFAPALVDKVIEENGEEDFDLILDALFTQSAIETPNSETLNSLGGACHLDGEEDDSSLDLSLCDSEEIEELKSGDADVDKRSSLLKMKFSVEDIDLAISRLGQNASLPELIDFIIAAQIAGSSGNHGTDANTEVVTTESLFRTMDKTLRLLEMGFTEEEISTVIDKFGSDPPVSELADSIFASRIAYGSVKEEKDLFSETGNNSWKEFKFCGDVTEEKPKRGFSLTGIGEYKASSSYSFENDSREMWEGKRAKRLHINDKASFYTKGEPEPSFRGMHSPYVKIEYKTKNGFYAEKAYEKTGLNGRSSNQCPSKPPYFFFGNVTDISQDTWGKLSRFLYGVEPEFVNTQFFSASIHKEGYLHNLPTENRCHILPKPPMTLEDALPHTKRWWPSWDTRKQLSCICSDTTGVARLCERLERVMMESRGILSKEQQIDTLHQCKTMNLLWVGENRLRPVEPDQVEIILGYPMQHTQIWGLEDTDRLKALKCSFQVDTLGYHLSPLKQIYPDGLRVLSVFSGTGGAEIALSRLGIRLQCVVSVEASEINRKILRRWWQQSGQCGQLRQIEGVERLSGKKIESMIEEFGGFDLVIAGNPCTYTSGSSHGDCPVGLDFSLFLEFVRVFQRVKGAMTRI